ncbi:phospholipid scramblase 2-like [Temnothorax longispinosus]|uniref:phospholipid scramblase 2-like n=1 Tax=Temnothorax longispinosus TaxID=300112 RepID=UPI003A990726
MHMSDCASPSTICPPGLEYLMGLDYLFVENELFEGWQTEMRDKFLITDNRGKQVFYIEQELRNYITCWGFCLGQYNSLYDYEYSAYDRNQQEILHMVRPFAKCCQLPVKSVDEQHVVGMIRRHWRGFSQEIFNFSGTKFGINFPRDLDVKIKAVLLGATILIDCLYFGKEK